MTKIYVWHQWLLRPIFFRIIKNKTLRHCASTLQIYISIYGKCVIQFFVNCLRQVGKRTTIFLPFVKKQKNLKPARDLRDFVHMYKVIKLHIEKHSLTAIKLEGHIFHYYVYILFHYIFFLLYVNIVLSNIQCSFDRHRVGWFDSFLHKYLTGREEIFFFLFYPLRHKILNLISAFLMAWLSTCPSNRNHPLFQSIWIWSDERLMYFIMKSFIMVRVTRYS